MSKKGYANIIALIAIIILLGGMGTYVVLNRQPQQTPTPTPTPVLEAPIIPGPITIEGETVCLPKKGQAAQTHECAIGFRGTTDGQYYGLKNLFKFDPEYKFSVSGLRVRISGTFSSEEMSGPAGAKYDVVGVIDVTSILLSPGRQ